jgi:hypothetical protein
MDQTVAELTQSIAGAGWRTLIGPWLSFDAAGLRVVDLGYRAFPREQQTPESLPRPHDSLVESVLKIIAVAMPPEVSHPRRLLGLSWCARRNNSNPLVGFTFAVSINASVVRAMAELGLIASERLMISFAGLVSIAKN